MGRRWDPRPFHTDPDAAKDSFFGGLVASSSHLFCIWNALSNDERDKDKWIETATALGFNNLQWHRPVRPNDVLSRRQELTESRDSDSKPGMRVATVTETLVNQDGEVVFTLDCSFLAPKRRTNFESS